MEPIRSVKSERDGLTAIYLEYGADAHECSHSDLNISERGMVFKSRWQFAVGTQLSLLFAYKDLFGRPARTEVEGIVVDCEQITTGGFNHLLIFPEITPELKAAIRDIHHARQNSPAVSLN